MPWNDQSGGNDNNGGGRGPWGQGPSGGGGGGGQGGGQGPDLEELLKRGQDRFRKAARGGGGGGGGLGGFGVGGLFLIVLIAAGMWISTGVYSVDAGEEGVILRFGKHVRSETPGLHVHMPWPIEAHFTPNIEQERRVNVGATEPGERRAGNLAHERLMLTGDENIVDIDFTVQWNIANASDYLFNVENPEAAVRDAAQSALREVVGQTALDILLTNDRLAVEVRVQEISQGILDEYEAGIIINRVNLQNVLPPPMVQAAFDDVQSAEQDEIRFQEDANRDAVTVVENARGEASSLVLAAEAYRDQTIAVTQGEAARFISIYDEYVLAPEVTRQRMYLETMERVFSNMDKIIIDESGSGTGVVPYLPLNELQSSGTRPASR